MFFTKHSINISYELLLDHITGEVEEGRIIGFHKILTFPWVALNLQSSQRNVSTAIWNKSSVPHPERQNHHMMPQGNSYLQIQAKKSRKHIPFENDIPNIW